MRTVTAPHADQYRMGTRKPNAVPCNLSTRSRQARSVHGTRAPAAYQNGPATPNVYATLADCSSVAAHVHLATMSHAVSPALMLRPAVEKDSESRPKPPKCLAEGGGGDGRGLGGLGDRDRG